ncbi:MAG: FKBP-type peptidyl-prolyl cis-trans isomerase [Bacteroidales bacterium]|nr:FKBP-type peptidyl-prolyl cis-trans isomerase [Bacteroidales bacterium]
MTRNSITAAIRAAFRHGKASFSAALALSAIALASCTSQSLETTYNNQLTKIDTYADGVSFIECELTVGTTTDEDGEIVSTGNYVMEKVDTITPRVTRNGEVVRITMVEGDGDQLGSKGKCTFHYAGYVFSSGPTTVQMAYLTMTDQNGDLASSWLFSTPYTSINVSGSVTTGAVISGSGSSSGLTIFGTNHYFTSQFVGWDLSGDDYDPMTVSLSDNTVLEGLRKGLEGVRAGEVCDIAFSAKYGLGKRELGTIPANSALLYRIWVDDISN